MAATVTAVERSITLSLTTDEFLALLSENVELAEGIFRMLIATHDLATGHTLIHGNLPPDMKDGGAHCSRSIACCCCNRARCSRNATAAQLWRLSAIAREATVAAGAEALPEGQRSGDPDRAVGIAEGRGRRMPDGTATAGDVIGMYETLAGSALGATITALTARRGVLRIDRGGLFELLADHTDLLQGIFSMLLRATPRAGSGRGKSGRTISNTVSTP